MRYLFLISILLTNYSFAEQFHLGNIEEELSRAVREETNLDNILRDLKIEEERSIDITGISQPNYSKMNKVIIQVLNKITAKTSTKELDINEEFRFGKIIITPRICWQNTKAINRTVLSLIAVEEIKEEQKEKTFLGWLFNNDRSINAIDHPFYDILLKDCK